MMKIHGLIFNLFLHQPSLLFLRNENYFEVVGNPRDAEKNCNICRNNYVKACYPGVIQDERKRSHGGYRSGVHVGHMKMTPNVVEEAGEGLLNEEKSTN